MRNSWVVSAILWLTALVSGAILAVRTLVGPIHGLLLVNSPLTPEGWFAISLLLLILLRSEESPQPVQQAVPWNRFDALAIAAVVFLIAAVFATSIHDYFLSDDFLIVRYANDYHFGFRQVFATAGGDGFFRPIANLSYALTAPWARFDPARWHIAELVLHAANAVLVFTLARALCMDRAVAWFAAALFAVHASRPEAAVWIAGRFDLQAAFFVLLALVLYLRSHALLALLAMIFGILSKESAYITPLLVALLPPPRGDSGWKNRARLNAPFLAAAALLFAYRWVLFGGVGGYADPSGRPQLLTFNVVSIVKALCFRLWAALFFPVNWSWEPGLLFGAFMLIYLITLAWLARNKAEPSRLILAIGFIVIAALPPLQQLLIGADLQKARYLYLPSVGVCLLMAVLTTGLSARIRGLVWCAVLAFQVAALEHNLGLWSYAASKTRPACLAVASIVTEDEPRVVIQGLPGSLNGVYFFNNGFPACVAAELDGKSSEIELQPATGGGHFPDFAWDAASAELRPVPQAE